MLYTLCIVLCELPELVQFINEQSQRNEQSMLILDKLVAKLPVDVAID
ncbi:hypothetical protein Lepto7375DRAFT_6047 [Leptolyngbya sp. PCC 7375]|nr:hypothetical protein Lepto7375DRAFT_6047 [Leptolyngbya sp. PCC 7375]